MNRHLDHAKGEPCPICDENKQIAEAKKRHPSNAWRAVLLKLAAEDAVHDELNEERVWGL